FIQRGLEESVDVLPLYEVDSGVMVRIEKLLQGLSGYSVAFILKPMYLLQDRHEVFRGAESLERNCQLRAGLCEALAETVRRVSYRTDGVEVDLVRRFFSQVDNLIERMSQVEDVLLVDRRHERAVGQGVDLMGDVVTSVLDLT